jgi:hypothetical protein
MSLGLNKGIRTFWIFPNPDSHCPHSGFFSGFDAKTCPDSGFDENPDLKNYFSAKAQNDFTKLDFYIGHLIWFLYLNFKSFT